MALKILRFLSLWFVCLSMAPSAAHLLELPAKIDLPKDQYLTVQQIHRGWDLLGIVVFGALLATLILTILVRRYRKSFLLTGTALLCLISANVLFWMYTFPANQQTNNWTMVPANWPHLRTQWEYSHAVAAVLNLCALTLLIFSVVTQDRRPVPENSPATRVAGSRAPRYDAEPSHAARS